MKNANSYSIKLGIVLDDKAIANIKKTLIKNFGKENIKINFDTKELDAVSKKVDSLNKKLKSSSATGLKKTGETAKKASKGVDDLNKSLEKTNKHIKNQNFATDNWAYNWAKAMQSFLTYSTVTQFFNTVKAGIQDMVEQVKELDAALVELQKVTDLEGEELEKFIDEAYRAGETVAKTGTEMIEAATAFAKAGYKDTALELGTIAAMYTNIADEAIDAADAADMIIAQMKAFNIQAEDAIHIIDAINEVSNNFAVSSADISRNLGKASAVMANAGNSMEQYIGLMTAATEVTRNASKAANGLKTLTLRLQGMNDEGEQDLEVQAQMEALFNKLGISVYKANGELKNTYEIMDTLAPIYKTLTNAEKAYVTETIAGKYQAQNAAAILNNWATAVEATKTAMNSAGSAAKENEKVLNSIRGHIQKLKSAWEEFSKKMIDSELIKFVVDLGTWILKLANSGFGQLVLKGTAILVIYKLLRTAFTKLVVNVKAYNIAMTKAYLLTQGYSKKAADAAVKNMTLGTSFELAGKSALTSLKTMGASVLKFLCTPVGLATAAVVALNIAIKLHNEAIEKHIERMKEMNEAYNENSKQIDESLEGFRKYRKILSDTNASEEEQKEAKKELLEIQNQLAEKYDTESEKLDLVNGKYEDQLSLLKEIEQIKSEKYLENNYKDINEAKDYLNQKIVHGVPGLANVKYEGNSKVESFLKETYAADERKTRDEWIAFYDKQIAKVKEYGAEWGLTKKEIETVVGLIGTSRTKITSDKQYKESQETYKNYIEAKIQTDEEYSKNYYKILDEQQKYAEAVEKGDVTAKEKALENIEKLRKEIYSTPISSSDKDAMEIQNYFGKMFKDYEKEISKHNFIKSFLEGDNGNTAREIDYFISHLKSDLKKDKITADDLFDINGKPYEEFSELAEKYGFSVDELTDKFIEWGVVAEGVNHIVSKFAGRIKLWSESVDALQEKYQDLAAVMEEYKETQHISVDSLQKLLEKDWTYLQYLEFENNKLKLNTEALRQEALAKLDEAEATAYADAIQSIKNLKSENELEVNKHLSTSYENLKGKIDAMHDSYTTLIGDETTLSLIRDANGEDGVKAYENVQKELETKLKLIRITRDNIKKNLNGALGGGSSSSSKKDKSSSSSSGKEWWETALDKLKDQYNNSEITINQYINGLNALLGKVKKGSDAWRKINQELQKQRLDKIKDDYDAGRISLTQYIKELQKLQKEYKNGTKGWKELANAIKKAKLDQLKEQENKLKSALSAVNNTLDKQIDKYTELKEAADDRYDDEIDKIDKIREGLSDKDDEYQRAQQAVMQYLDEQLNQLNDQKDSIENYYNTVINSIEKMNEEEKEALELAEAYEALMNAMTQKTKKVWKEGLGWVWTADQEAIDSAKKSYEDLVKKASLNEIEKQKDKTAKTLDDQINLLQEYIDSWDKVFEKYDNEKNKSLADILLGENWQEMVSQLDPQVVEDFSNAYYDLQKNLDETQKKLDELNELKDKEDEYWEALIKDLKDYKQQWDDVADAYEDAQDALAAKQLIGANWEKQILEKRIDVLNNFKNKYNAILAEIDKVGNMSDDKASTYTPYKLPGFASGGEVDFTGLAMLHGSPGRPEYVLNNDQIRNLLGNLTRPQITPVKGGSSNCSYNTYNFGNIELPNVNNAQQFLNELKSIVNTSRNL